MNLRRHRYLPSRGAHRTLLLLVRVPMIVIGAAVLLAIFDPATRILATIHGSELSGLPGSVRWRVHLGASPAYAASAAADIGDDSGDAIPRGYWEEPAHSAALTTHLQKNRLPLVRAKVFTNSSGDQQVILYGFVATQRGKQNAAIRTRRHLGNPTAIVIDRIALRPELLASGSSGADPSFAPAPPSDIYDGDLGTAQSYREQTQEAQRQQQEMQRQQELNTMLLLMRIIAGFL